MSESNLSSEVNAVTSLPKPSDVSISISSTVNITWQNNDNSSDGSVFVERSDDGGSTFSNVSGSLSVGTTSYGEQPPSEQDSAQYRVGRSTDHTTSRSSSVTVQLLQTVTDLTVDSVGETSISISWTDTNDSESGYKVLTSTDGGSTFSNTSGDLSANTTSHTISGLTAGETYTIKVDSFNASTSVSSDTVSATTNFSNPTSLSVQNISNTSIDIQWIDNSNAESGYRVLTSTDGGSTFSNTSGDLSPNTTSYTISGLTSGETYTIKVSAFNSAESVESNTVTTTTTFDPPQNLSSQLSNGFDKGIELTWDIPDTSTSGSVKILRRAAGESLFTEIASIPPSTEIYTDTTFPKRGGTYEYKIRRVIQTVFKDSVATSIQTLGKPEIDFTLKNPSVTILKIASVPSQASSVEVYKSTSSGDTVADYTLLQTVQPPFNDAIVDQNAGASEDHYRIAAIADNIKVLSDEVLAEKVGNFSADNATLDVAETLGEYDI